MMETSHETEIEDQIEQNKNYQEMREPDDRQANLLTSLEQSFHCRSLTTGCCDHGGRVSARIRHVGSANVRMQKTNHFLVSVGGCTAKTGSASKETSRQFVAPFESKKIWTFGCNRVLIQISWNTLTKVCRQSRWTLFNWVRPSEKSSKKEDNHLLSATREQRSTKVSGCPIKLKKRKTAHNWWSIDLKWDQTKQERVYPEDVKAVVVFGWLQTVRHMRINQRKWIQRIKQGISCSRLPSMKRRSNRKRRKGDQSIRKVNQMQIIKESEKI